MEKYGLNLEFHFWHNYFFSQRRNFFQALFFLRCKDIGLRCKDIGRRHRFAPTQKYTSKKYGNKHYFNYLSTLNLYGDTSN